MAVFDPYLSRLRECLERIQNRGVSARQSFPPPDADLGFQGGFLRSDANSAPGIILRSETFVELGNPLAGSCSFVLWTDDPSLLRNGSILLLGRDIPESPGVSLPFGQVLLVAGRTLTERDTESLVQAQYVGHRIEGYMIRSAPDRIWSRVSRDAVRRGFDFRILGRALMQLVMTEQPKVEAAEVVFVTSSKEDLRDLESIGVQVNKLGKEIMKENWKIRGYDLDCRLDCNSCMDKSVCDNIREVLAVRRKKAEDKDDSSGR